MTTKIETITLTTSDGAAMPIDVAAPGARGKGIIIVPSVFGNTDDVHRIMGTYADRGYLVMAPDPFWRSIPGAMSRDEADVATAKKRYAEFDVDLGVSDLGDAVKAMRAHDLCTGKVAVMGYCFGGRYAYLAGTRLGVDGAISFHGTKIGLNLDEADKLACPMTIHVGDSDTSIPMEEVNATRAALAGNSAVEINVYPGCAHGFTGRGRPAYDAHADTTSTNAALALLEAM
ncbi:MAG: dienelactone hydrolase family protein [Alphaproteobacteria bacterium]|jgi:carboxymethylenebutenolidase